MKSRLHAIAGGIALLTISSFWLSTLLVEVFGTSDQIAWVKQAIPYGFILLIPALALTGFSGNLLASGRASRLISAKRKRMMVIAANGIIILIPAALFLASKANAREFDTFFYSVQALELIIGGINLGLLGLNMRDGLRMTRTLRRTQA